MITVSQAHDGQIYEKHIAPLQRDMRAENIPSPSASGAGPCISSTGSTIDRAEKILLVALAISV